MQPTLRQQYLGMRILHAALIAPLAIYGAVLFVIMKPRAAPINPRLLLGILGAVALLLVLVVVPIARKKLMPERRTSGDPVDHSRPLDERVIISLNRLRATSILTWAMCESTAMLGLVAGFLTGEPMYYLPFAGIALISLLMYMPNRQLFDSVIRAATP